MSFQQIDLLLSILIPVGLIFGVYVNLKTNVTRNEEKIVSMKKDITEIKAGVSSIKKVLMKNDKL